jgi:hypothetical protein
MPGTSVVTGTVADGQRATLDRYQSDHKRLYPDTSFVRGILAEHNRLRAILDQVVIVAERGYGRVSPEEMPKKIEQLEEAHRKALVAAEKLRSAELAAHVRRNDHPGEAAP